MKATSPGVLVRLENFLVSHSDGEWEHMEGIVLESLDNPGWWLRVQIDYTVLFDRNFESINIQRSEHDWIICRLKDGFFEGMGGQEI